MELIVNREFSINNYTIYIKFFKLHNSFLLLISDQEDLGIGNVTLGTPSTIEGIRTPNVSYNLFGMENKLISTIIVEKASKVLKAPVLLLFFLKVKNDEEIIIKPLVNFINEVLKDLSKNLP